MNTKILCCLFNSLAVTMPPVHAAVQFELAKQVVQESDGKIVINVVRVKDSILAPFTVDFATSNQSAIAGVDYTATQGTLSFSAGETVQQINIPILDEGQIEGEEQFSVRLTNASGGVQIGNPSVATIIIMDSTGMLSHRFDNISITGAGDLNFRVVGDVSPPYKLFLDLYPIETSADLLEWSLLSTIVKTNTDTRPLLLTHLVNDSGSQHFYRTAMTNLPTAYPPPTGPYQVGTYSRILTDVSRTNRYGIATNNSFMATFWYPAAPKEGELPNLMFGEALSKQFVVASVDARRTYFRCMQFAGRSLATNEAAYPVIIYSCGGDVYRQDNILLALELASRGFIVVSADHEDLNIAELPDGRLVSGTLPADSVPTYKSRFQDVQILLATLETMNRSDPVLRDGLDFKRIGVCGWSTGGVCAAQLCLEDERIKTGVLLDPGLIEYVPHLVSTGIGKPFLVITGELNDGMQLFNKAVGPAYWLHIAGSVHLNMGIPPVVNEGGPTTRRIQQVLQAYAVSMLEKYLREHDDRLLDGPSLSFPEVKTVLKKNS